MQQIFTVPLKKSKIISFASSMIKNIASFLLPPRFQ